MKEMMLKIKGTQRRPDEEDEVIEFITMSRVYQKGKATYIMYDETELSGMEGMTTTLKITDDMASVIRFDRSDGSSNRFDFGRGQTKESHYTTPMGDVDLVIGTNSIENCLSGEDGGHARIDYELSLMGVMNSKNVIDIEICGGKQNESENC